MIFAVTIKVLSQDTFFYLSPLIPLSPAFGGICNMKWRGGDGDKFFLKFKVQSNVIS
jgi:uncharacterized membrane protein (GlpM family)